jgi:hypothetical protein
LIGVSGDALLLPSLSGEQTWFIGGASAATVRNTILPSICFVLEAFNMLKVPTPNSIQRCLNLASFIDLFGDIMPVACCNCRNAGLVCRVHIKSGRCGECNRSNAKDCNIRISENE